MDDGYYARSEKTICLCTDNFTLDEVELLIDIFNIKFGFIARAMKRVKENKEICWRIKFSSETNNINKIRNLVYPYFIESMYYKLDLGEKP